MQAVGTELTLADRPGRYRMVIWLLDFAQILMGYTMPQEWGEETLNSSQPRFSEHPSSSDYPAFPLYFENADQIK